MKKEKITSILVYGLSTLIFLTIGIRGQSLGPLEEPVFVLFTLYITMPITTLVMSFILASKKNPAMYLYPITFGFAGLLTTNIIWPGFEFALIIVSLLITFVPAMIGLTLGILLYNYTLHKL